MPSVQLFVQLLHEDSKIPHQATTHASGFDVYAYLDPKGEGDDPEDPEDRTLVIYPHTTEIISTGIKVGTEEGFDVKLFPRSGLAAKRTQSVTLSNAVAVIDIDYCTTNICSLKESNDDDTPCLKFEQR